MGGTRTAHERAKSKVNKKGAGYRLTICEELDKTICKGGFFNFLPLGCGGSAAFFGSQG